MTEVRKPEDCPKDVLLRVLEDSFQVYQIDGLDSDDLAAVLRLRGVKAVSLTMDELVQEDADDAAYAGDRAAHRKMDGG